MHISGDSFVEGVGATDNFGWAQQIANAIDRDAVSLSGIGGSTSSDLINRLPTELTRSIDALVVSVGINDSRIRPSRACNEVPPDDYRRNVEQLVELGRHAGVVVTFLIGLTRVDDAKTTPFKADKFYDNAEIANYDAVLKGIAVDHADVRYVPVPALNDVAGHLDDGLHASDKGHRALFDAISPVLRTVLSV